MSSPKQTPCNVIPSLRYRDAPKAIDWLCSAFGFEKSLVVPGEGDSVVHAQLRFGNGMVMLGTAGKHGGPFDELITIPSEVGGIGTQSAYVIVEDVDAHCARARAAGAEILIEPADQDYGGRNYVCRDPEGHVWSFGSYDPFTA